MKFFAERSNGQSHVRRFLPGAAEDAHRRVAASPERRTTRVGHPENYKTKNDQTNVFLYFCLITFRLVSLTFLILTLSIDQTDTGAILIFFAYIFISSLSSDELKYAALSRAVHIVGSAFPFAREVPKRKNVSRFSRKSELPRKLRKKLKKVIEHSKLSIVHNYFLLPCWTSGSHSIFIIFDIIL